MARKNLLGDIGEGPQPSPAPRRRTGGAIGAVGRSIADLKANAVVEIDPRMIDHAGIRDRLEDPDGEGAAAHAALMESLAEYGQQVPVLVRHSPNVEGRYEVIYGRRRVAALADLGRPIRAMIRDMPDRDLIVVQGQENAARRDLTFVEKVNFARRMRDMDFERKVICDALQIDKTVISRMLAVADAVPEELIAAIGPAPGIGRDRWVALARLIAPERIAGAVRAAEAATGSDARFEAALAAVRPRREPPTPPRWRLARGKAGPAIRFAPEQSGFADWVHENLDSLHADWSAGQGDPET